MKRNFVVLLAIAAISLAGCFKDPDDEECISYHSSPVTQVDGPSTAAVNQEIDLVVSFTCFNGCGQFGSFEKVTVVDTTHVNVLAKYQGCMCTQDIPVRQAIYKFKAAQAGTYYLKFRQDDNTILTETITVQ